MYGLMKARVCSRHAEDAYHRHLHYCGTCKTMGRLYGQKSRFLLNNDAIFLAELLTALSPQTPAVTDWSRAYQSVNCFALPDSGADMPLSLQVAATATLVMTEFKVDDQIADAAHGGWKLARKLFSQSFVDATERMNSWGFPMDQLGRWGGMQEAREREASQQERDGSALERIAYVAEPTATVTGLVFQHGAATVGSDAQTQRTMYDLGFAFGALIYVLDAYEDYAQDARRGDFNALRTAFQTQSMELPDCYRAATCAHVRDLRARVAATLQALPLPPGQAAKFAARLHSNLARKLGEALAPDGTDGKEATACATPAPQHSLADRWKAALSLARTLSERHRTQQPASPVSYLLSPLTRPFVFLSVLAIALISPGQALATTSYSECRDLAFNLLFLTAAFRALWTAPQRLLPALAPAGFAHRSVLHADTDPPQGSSNLTHSSSRKPTSTTIVKVRRRNNCCGGTGDFCCDIACCEGIQCCGDGCCCACDSCACDACACDACACN